MAVLLAFLLLFGFVGFGAGSQSSGSGHVRPYQSTKLHAFTPPRQLRRDPCSDGSFSRSRGHTKPLPMRSCAIRAGVSP